MGIQVGLFNDNEVLLVAHPGISCRLVDDVSWVKVTVNRRLAKGHGFYLQHAKETCLVGVKGDISKLPFKYNGNIASDVIIAERRGQSQKPTEIYELIEELVPNGGSKSNAVFRWGGRLQGEERQ